MTYENELEAALRLDGEKLRALTGEDHGPWQFGDTATYSGEGYWLPDDINPAAEVAELREQLATMRKALARLSTYEAMTTEGWGFDHPEITARVEFANAALAPQVQP